MGEVLHKHQALSSGPQHPPVTLALEEDRAVGTGRSQEASGHSSCSRRALSSGERLCLEKEGEGVQLDPSSSYRALVLLL